MAATAPSKATPIVYGLDGTVVDPSDTLVKLCILPKPTDVLARALKGKLAARDERRIFSITPHHANPAWSFKLAGFGKGGIPVEAFGDTRDKLVFHMGHLGYKYDYFWGRNDYSGNSCWYDTDDKKAVAMSDLSNLARCLNAIGVVVWLAAVDGDSRGNLRTEVYSGDVSYDCRNVDTVLFAFGIAVEPGPVPNSVRIKNLTNEDLVKFEMERHTSEMEQCTSESESEIDD